MKLVEILTEDVRIRGLYQANVGDYIWNRNGRLYRGNYKFAKNSILIKKYRHN